MTRTELQRHVAYSGWATARTIEACRAVPEAELRKNAGNSFGGILDTLEHAYFADRAWLLRLKQQPRSRFQDEGEHYSLDELARLWSATQREWEKLAENADPDEICHYRTFSGIPFSHSIGLVTMHVVNHASYHRGQVATMLRQLGYKPVGTDMIEFCRA